MKKMITLCLAVAFIGLFAMPGVASVIEYKAGGYSTPTGGEVIAQHNTDLDHYYYYVWTFNDLAPTSQMGGLNIVFHDIRNWTQETNSLDVYLFNNPDNALGWNRLYDGQDIGLPVWNDLNSTAAFLGKWSYNATTEDVVFSTSDATLLSYLFDGGTFGIGIDPDCHFYGNGITVETTPAAPVPEPATLLLLGTGLMGIGAFRKKFRSN